MQGMVSSFWVSLGAMYHRHLGIVARLGSVGIPEARQQGTRSPEDGSRIENS